jgi:3,4-dihydroxy 2-butanone 4-phosphate synthase/GTP cyclohydrolase II
LSGAGTRAPHPAPRQEDSLRGASSTADSIAALVQDLAETRARVRPRDRPFVTLAYAQSLDGSITTARGERWSLSGPPALRLTHALRARHDAILVGVGTVLTDDPELSVRLVDGPSPQPIIVDSQARTPTDAKLFARPGGAVWVAATAPDGSPAHEARIARLEAHGGRVFACPRLPNGWVDLSALLRCLGAEGVRHVMVEGGARIITSFLEGRLCDYVLVTIAPQILGGLAAVEPSARPRAGAAVANLRFSVSARLGDDLVLGGEVAWPAG